MTAEADMTSSFSTSENPPPFLPILLSLSRNLCRIFSKKSSNFSGDKDGASYRPVSSGYDFHIPPADVLEEADENREVDGLNFEPPEELDNFSHVRRVVERFDGRIFNDIRSPSGYRHTNDFFSQEEFSRYMPRTTSFSSLNSVISDLSADPNECNIVSQRTAQFEKGNVARAGPKSIGEREGHVLDRQPSNDDLAPHLSISPSHQETEADVFGATIKPKKRNDAHITIPVSSLALLANTGLGHVGPPTSPLSSTPAQVANINLSKSASPHDTSARLKILPDDKLTPEKETGTRDGMLEGSQLSARDTSKSVGEFVDQLWISPEAGHPGPQQPRDKHTTYNALSDAIQEPQYVARMAEHEKHSVLRGLPKNNAVHGDMLSLFSFKPPTNADAVNPSRYPSADPRFDDSVLLQDTTNRLVLAEARIQTLERALAEIVEKQKTSSRRIRSFNCPDPTRLGSDEHEASSLDQTSENSGDKFKLTITNLLAWITGGSTTLSPTSPAVPFAVPETLRHIPGYVFLVGVGLSVIVVRTVFLHPYSRANSTSEELSGTRNLVLSPWRFEKTHKLASRTTNT
ncbi:hypothetical protein QFC19_005500 [Naganishia cerealis]|uniref:Uncharacterized protein n=1 Tax=Naganishia cerealis TaxID=610337 RepID=A0ACC2VNS8_9TREE|nr:hypothetical protein QFC19_005500 [Naganishia cerealis]